MQPYTTINKFGPRKKRATEEKTVFYFCRYLCKIFSQRTRHGDALMPNAICIYYHTNDKDKMNVVFIACDILREANIGHIRRVSVFLKLGHYFYLYTLV